MSRTACSPTAVSMSAMTGGVAGQRVADKINVGGGFSFGQAVRPDPPRTAWSSSSHEQAGGR